MTSSALPRNLIIFSLLLPVALLVGYLLATPGDTLSFFGVGAVVLVTMIPLLLRWHHATLIVTWNMAVTVFFLPGQPNLWMLIALGSLTISFLQWLLTKNDSFLHVPALTWSLVALVLATLFTAKITGGIGLRSMGSQSYGGKQYVLIFFGVIGYFALTFKRIPLSQARLMSSLFFVSALTGIVSNLAYFGGPAFYFLYWVFPAGFAFMQAQADWMVDSPISRLGGFSLAGESLIAFFLLRYGIRGLLDFSKPWRLPLFLVVIFGTLLGGFRSSIVITGLLTVSLFILERLYRTRLMIGAVTFLILLGAFLVTNATRLPMAVQRSLSILPIEIDPIAKYNADVTTEWRLRIWRYLLPEVPKHLIKPKGFTLDPTELYLINEAQKRGMAEDIDVAISSGTYHSGPLSLVLGLGIWGTAAFLWFVVAAFRVLYRNYRYGPPELQSINSFLFAYFFARVIYYVVIFGAFSDDLFIFTGIVGLSVSLNGGERKPVLSEKKKLSPGPAATDLLPQPAT